MSSLTPGTACVSRHTNTKAEAYDGNDSGGVRSNAHDRFVLGFSPAGKEAGLSSAIVPVSVIVVAAGGLKKRVGDAELTRKMSLPTAAD